MAVFDPLLGTRTVVGTGVLTRASSFLNFWSYAAAVWAMLPHLFRDPGCGVNAGAAPPGEAPVVTDFAAGAVLGRGASPVGRPNPDGACPPGKRLTRQHRKAHPARPARCGTVGRALSWRQSIREPTEFGSRGADRCFPPRPSPVRMRPEGLCPGIDRPRGWAGCGAAAVAVAAAVVWLML